MQYLVIRSCAAIILALSVHFIAEVGAVADNISDDKGLIDCAQKIYRYEGGTVFWKGAGGSLSY